MRAADSNAARKLSRSPESLWSYNVPVSSGVSTVASAATATSESGSTKHKLRAPSAAKERSSRMGFRGAKAE